MPMNPLEAKNKGVLGMFKSDDDDWEDDDQDVDEDYE